MTRSRLFAGCAAVALLAVAGVARAADLTVAVAGPFTGQLAALGEQLKRGAEQFVADQNAKGGVLGSKLVLQLGDDQCDPKQAVAVANQLSTKQVAVVVGHACSGSSIPASDVYAENGIVEITPSSTNPTFTERGLKNVFRTIGRDDQQGAFAGAYIARQFPGKVVGIVQDKSAYGKGLADRVKASINGAGIKEALYEGITAGDKDFSALITKLKAAHVEVLYFGGYHPEAGLILREASDQGLKVQLIGGDALNTAEFTSIAGPAGDGTLFSFAPDARNLPGAKAVTDSFKAAGFDPEGYTLFTYAAFQAWAAAAEAAKSVKEPDIEKALRAGTFTTVIGLLEFDAKGDLKQPSFEMNRWSGNKFAPVP